MKKNERGVPNLMYIVSKVTSSGRFQSVDGNIEMVEGQNVLVQLII